MLKQMPVDFGFDGIPVSFVKWDCNRAICDKYSGMLDSSRQGEFAHRYVLGLYRVLEKLTEKFPEILFEGCGGGGGRFDAGMLYYTPQLWGSDIRFPQWEPMSRWFQTTRPDG